MDRDHLANDPHRGQDHDVDGRVAVEPKKVLKEHRVTTVSRIEDSDFEGPLRDEQQERDTQDGRRKDLHDAGRVDEPEDKGHAVPRHSWRAELVDGDNEVEARQDAQKPMMKTPSVTEMTDVAVVSE